MRRFEDERLVTGRGTYAYNQVPPDALHVQFARSDLAHATITGIDAADAEALDGVVAVYTSDNLDLPLMPPRSGAGEGTLHPWPPLAKGTVRFFGEAVAVVVGEDRESAEAGADLVWLDGDPLPAVIDLDEALAGETLLFPETGSNVALREELAEGPEPGADGLREVSIRVEHPRVSPAPLEVLSCVVTPTERGLHLTVGTQALYAMKAAMASLFDLPENEVRVTLPDVGGAFGMKRMFPEHVVAAAIALKHRRPVAWRQRRTDCFTAAAHGRGMRHDLTLTVDETGRIHAARFHLVTDAGAYPHTGSHIGRFTRLVGAGQYDIPRIEYLLEAVVTNKTPMAPYRGAGRPEAALTIERGIDEVARVLGVDPVDVRRRNFVTAWPHTSPTGALYDSGDYAACLNRALEMVGYDEVRAEQAERRVSGGMPLGIGFSAYLERCGGALDSGEYGATELLPDGSLRIWSGTAPSGQSHETVWREVAARVFEVPWESVDLVLGDTDRVPRGAGSFASRSAQMAGSVLHVTATRIRDRAAEIAAELLEAAPDDVEVSAGHFRVKGAPGSEVSLAEVAGAAAGKGERLFEEDFYVPGKHTFPYGCHVAVVEVDPDTGEIQIVKMVAVDDVGVQLDEGVVHGQLVGSLMQGIGCTLMEEMLYDTDGQPQSASFMSYAMPKAQVDMKLSTASIVTPSPFNPLGAKGAGEGGCIGMPAALVNATLDALAPLGVTDLQIPLTPPKVWAAIHRPGT